jgi:hypothetical protein
MCQLGFLKLKINLQSAERVTSKEYLQILPDFKIWKLKIGLYVEPLEYYPVKAKVIC